MDPMDHEADSGHNNNHNPGRAEEYQVADNVTPMRKAANDNKNLDLGPGIDIDANWKSLVDSQRPKPKLVK